MKTHKRFVGAWLVVSALLSLTSCNTFVDLDQYDASYVDNNTNPNNSNNLPFNNLPQNNLPSSCDVSSDWRGAKITPFPSIEASIPSARAGLDPELSLSMKNNGDVFIAYKFFGDQGLGGSVDLLQINAEGTKLEKTTKRVDIGSSSIPGMPIFVEALTIGGAADEDVKIGVVGGGCDEFTMMPFDNLPFVWFVEWDPTQGNRTFDRYDGISIEDGICANWPPSNDPPLPSPVMGRAAILESQEQPQLIFRAAGGMGPGMPQSMFWTSVYATSGSIVDTMIPAYLDEVESYIPAQIIPLGDGPLVMAQSDIRGAWTIWNSYEGGTTSLFYPGSDFLDIVPDRGSRTDFIMSAVKNDAVALSTMTCNEYEEGGNPNADRCSPPRELASIQIGAPVFDAKIISINDSSSQDPTVLLITVEAGISGDAVRARLVRLNGENPCLGNSEVINLMPPKALPGAIGELRVGSRVVPNEAGCSDVVVAASHGDFGGIGPGPGPGPGNESMVWASGFRMCTP